MAQIIKLRRSAVQDRIPSTANLGAGELAINTYDGKIYFEKNAGSAAVEAVLTSNTTTPISGSLNMSGSMFVTGSMNAVGGRIYEEGTSVIDHATAMAIVFGG